MLGQPEQAVAAFRQSLKLQPSVPEAHYWLGKTLIQIGNVAEGRKELDTFQQSQAAELRQAAALFERSSRTKMEADTPASDSNPKQK